jgi:hypothetical protein
MRARKRETGDRDQMIQWACTRDEGTNATRYQENHRDRGGGGQQRSPRLAPGKMNGHDQFRAEYEPGVPEVRHRAHDRLPPGLLHSEPVSCGTQPPVQLHDGR